MPERCGWHKRTSLIKRKQLNSSSSTAANVSRAASHEQEAHVDPNTSGDPARGHPALVVRLSHNAAMGQAAAQCNELWVEGSVCFTTKRLCLLQEIGYNQ